ncbi:phosphotransferase [Nocardia sp. NPDC051990]|uniref:phosphotransferase n=1 Tax=Nocardia sp. NPDC051990 TaxID=3155285 RepID=UPI0034458602
MGKPGSLENAEQELRVSKWLNGSGIPTVEAVSELPQPIVVDDRPVTWWHLSPDHRPATPAELGAMLRALHSLASSTDFELPSYGPFGDLRERLAAVGAADENDRMRLLARYYELRQQYDRLPEPLRLSVIHGDAWQGNLVVRHRVSQQCWTSIRCRLADRNGISSNSPLTVRTSREFPRPTTSPMAVGGTLERNLFLPSFATANNTIAMG